MFRLRNKQQSRMIRRLISALPTIEYLLKHNAKVIIVGHLGRPKGVDIKKI
jgi:3-phosphoglycerate kinase